MTNLKLRSSIYIGNSFISSEMNAISQKKLPGVNWPFGWIQFLPNELVVGYPSVRKSLKYSDITDVKLARSGYIQISTNSKSDNFGFNGPSNKRVLDGLSEHGVAMATGDIVKKSNVGIIIALAIAILLLIIFGLMAVIHK